MPNTPHNAKQTLRETDLAGPVREYLVAQGYTVRSEVRNCDMTASKGDNLIVIELKRSFSAGLLFQATDRQRLCDSVYVALPRHDALRTRTRWRGVQRVLRRLELGLILVDLDKEPAWVDVVFHPVPCDRKRSSRARRAVLEEMAGRSDDYNAGGSAGTKLVTAYRENAIRIACCLEAHGSLTPRELREMGTGQKTTSILNSDFYEWFERVDRGVYRIRAKGRAALKRYPELVQRIRNEIEAESPEKSG